MPYFTSNGANMYVALDGQGTPLLFAHGFTLDHRQWNGQATRFAAAHQVVRVDLRGHGRSAATTLGHTFTHRGVDMHRAMTQVGIDRLQPGFLIGHSLAADAVLQAALAEPRAVRGVVLVTPAIWGMEWSADWKDRQRRAREQARAGDLAAALATFREDAIFDGVRRRAEAWQLVQEMQAAFSGTPWLSDERADGAPTLQRLEQAAFPVLVVLGDDDREQFQVAGHRVAEDAPRAHVERLAGVGHFPNLEDPAAFDRILADFIAEHL